MIPVPRKPQGLPLLALVLAGGVMGVSVAAPQAPPGALLAEPAVAARFYVVAHFRVSSKAADAARPVFRTHAEISRADDGNLACHILENRDDAELFTTVETWRDQAALDAHQGTAHYAAFKAQRQPMLMGKPEVFNTRLVQ